MGWQDHDPECYQRITGLSYATDLPLDGSPPKVSPHWKAPAILEKCSFCGAQGDYMEGFRTGECACCDVEVCRECGKPDDDIDGTVYTCRACQHGGCAA